MSDHRHVRSLFNRHGQIWTSPKKSRHNVLITFIFNTLDIYLVTQKTYIDKNVQSSKLFFLHPDHRLGSYWDRFSEFYLSLDTKPANQ